MVIIHEYGSVTFVVSKNDTLVTIIFPGRVFKVWSLEGGAWALTKNMYDLGHLECTQKIQLK